MRRLTRLEWEERKAQLVRIEAIVAEHFGRTLASAEVVRFLEYGTFAPDVAAQIVAEDEMASFLDGAVPARRSA